MTPAQPPHPLNCMTCSKPEFHCMGLVRCPITKELIGPNDPQRKLVDQIGCASHTSASSQRIVREGDIIQTGLILANGDGSIDWGTHQIVRWISSDGTLWYRPREGKVDKTPQHWRFPVESKEQIIKDLKCYANPKEAKEAIALLQEGDPK